MSITEDFDKIDRIAEVSARINEAAESAADYVSKVEKRLLDVEAGVVVWDGILLEEESAYQPSKEEPAIPAQRKVTFGFAKVKSKWGFAVREEFFTRSAPGKKEYTEPAYEKISLLRKSDRDLRILAAEHVPALLDQILAAVSEKLDRLVPQAETSGADDTEETGDAENRTSSSSSTSSSTSPSASSSTSPSASSSTSPSASPKEAPVEDHRSAPSAP
jgi:hypothetical protein